MILSDRQGFVPILIYRPCVELRLHWRLFHIS